VELILNLIRKEDRDREWLSKLDYFRHLWLEKEIKTVANVTRRDGEELLALVSQMHLDPQIQLFTLEHANEALYELKRENIRGSKVLKIR